MNKLEIIAKALEKNPDIIIFGPKEEKYLDRGHDAHTVIMY